MKSNVEYCAVNKRAKTWLKNSLLISAGFSTLALAPSAFAQDSSDDEVIVTGIRQSLANALVEKRNADSLIEVILAEDIGKLPDQNLAEVLENVTGVQITRTAGVGTGVQIRGTDDNRVEINGVNTVGTGTGRGGTSFEDLAAGIIAGVEVIKAPEASTIEGSIGGTINLRTIRPLELDDTLASFRIQGEDSSLSSEGGITPRFSGALGNKWENAAGQEIGIVISGSYTEQEASSLRPRVDRDGSLVENADAVVVRTNSDGDPVFEDQPTQRPVAQDFDFLGIQFLNQEFENFEFDTLNLAGTIEARPTPNLKLFIDGIYTDQERRQDSTRVQGSGVSSVLNQNLPTDFETVNFGSLDGVDLGSIQAAVLGVIEPDLARDDDDPNLRFNSDTGARVTETILLRAGAEWEKGNLSASGELSLSDSDTVTPTFSTQLNFINPNCPLDNLDADGNPTNSTVDADGDRSSSTSNDNCVPFRYDLTGGDLTFGINFDSPFAPTVADLLNPANVVLDQVDLSQNSTENRDEAARFDISYDFEDSSFGNFLSSVDFGYRYNKNESTFEDRDDRIGGFSRLEDSPSGSLFSSILIAGPDNAGDADGRELALRNFLIVDPDLAFSDPAGTLAIIEGALAAHRLDNPNAGGDLTADLSLDSAASFTIEEETHSIYGQANFDFGLVRGNAGLRYIDTTVDSIGNTIAPDGTVTQVVTTGGYDFLLPRINLISEPVENFVIRASYGEDIARPDFGNLNTSTTFSTNENQVVSIGNPNLAPQEVEAYDISAEWYFAPSAVFSVGYFQKNRTNLFAGQLDSALILAGGLREAGPNCTSGVFNPEVQPNVLGDPNSTGLCVDANTIVNDPETLKQRGVEVAFQYDLSSWEDRLGSFDWASGFGLLANYTYQEFSGGSVTNNSAGRGTDIFNAINGIYDSRDFVTVTALEGLLNNSENSYNITGFYEKFGLSARLRYTWRDAFRTDDTAAGASRNSTLGFPVVTAARGQFNGSVSYDVTDHLTVGVEGVNLTKAGVTQFCVNDDALLCFQGIADRRITFGASYTF